MFKGNMLLSIKLSSVTRWHRMEVEQKTHLHPVLFTTHLVRNPCSLPRRHHQSRYPWPRPRSSKGETNAHTTRTCPVASCRVFRAIATTVAALCCMREGDRDKERGREKVSGYIDRRCCRKNIQLHVIIVPVLGRMDNSHNPVYLMYCTIQSR